MRHGLSKNVLDEWIGLCYSSIRYQTYSPHTWTLIALLTVPASPMQLSVMLRTHGKSFTLSVRILLLRMQKQI